jgi:hypothetical protein
MKAQLENVGQLEDPMSSIKLILKYSFLEDRK